MHCIKKITENLLWVGANDRRLSLFEGVYSVPGGVSYNSYLLLDGKTVLFDTVDKAVQGRFLENLKEGLAGRPLDYLILQHLEPDHSAALEAILERYPGVTLVLNEKSAQFVGQFFELAPSVKIMTVNEGESLNTGAHTLQFYMAPMVHWPEVMVTYDATTKTLFSADAFGSFGALNGALFADEVNFGRDYLDETRRYYANIVGKYGAQTQALLSKAAGLEIKTICPLHGFVWRKNLHEIVEPHALWSAYEPEEKGVMIAYASVYGNTENAAEILACRLRDRGVKTVMFDVSVTPASEIVAEAFKWSHLVFASTTYNAGIFVNMEALIYDLVAHNIQNRSVALIENGSWASTSGSLMRKKLEQCQNMRFFDTLSIKSSVKQEKLAEINALAGAIAADFPAKAAPPAKFPQGADPTSLFKIPYGLYVLTAKDGGKDNGCIVNTVAQVTDKPLRISVTVNKANYTHDMIAKTGELAVSVLSQETPFSVFKNFGFCSGKDSDKFAGAGCALDRTANGLYGLLDYTNAIIAGKVISQTDCGTHTIFIADVMQAQILSGEPSLTYDYYFKNVKPKPPAAGKAKKAGFICKICNYVYEGETLPADYVCPLCKHGADDFVKM
ncbi:MAG: flavin reductase [Spirochaetes bacterium]|nr:flavin reductase [Spirochaetota bacterium]